MKLRNYLILAGLAVGLIMVGCGSKEAEQRAAFINILQTKVIAAQGFTVPVLTEEERGKIGPYADHLQLFIDFNTAVGGRMTEMSEAMIKIGQLRPSKEPQANLEAIAGIKDAIGKMSQSVDEEYAAAEAKKNALKQPDDLKVVFDQAFDKALTRPVQALKNMTAKIDLALEAQKNLYEFVMANMDKVDLGGPMITIKDKSIEAQLNKLMAEANQKAADLGSGQVDFLKALQ